MKDNGIEIKILIWLRMIVMELSRIEIITGMSKFNGLKSL